MYIKQIQRDYLEIDVHFGLALGVKAPKRRQ